MFSTTTAVLAADGNSALGGNIFMIVLLLAMFLLLFVLPSRRQRKYLAELQDRQSRMVTGTRVKTAWGLYGTIVTNDDRTGVVQLEIAPNTIVEVDRTVVTEIIEPVAGQATEAEEK